LRNENGNKLPEASDVFPLSLLIDLPDNCLANHCSEKHDDCRDIPDCTLGSDAEKRGTLAVEPEGTPLVIFHNS
jgi:hypothetical protein